MRPVSIAHTWRPRDTPISADSAAVGRFAPSPTGPLHFGSVVAAVASFLAARAAGGRWLLRIDDLDPPRTEPGATAAILATLAALELHWDGPVVYQSERSAAYRAALADLARAGATYACACSRRRVGAGPYPGTCRGLGLADGAGRTLRVKVDAVPITFEDRVQGAYGQALATHCGDFVVRRADGIAAYHLACVVDDAAAGVSEVVRGVDLLESTPRQIHLQRLLGLPQPRYAHPATVLDAAGHKLSKQTYAKPVTPATAPPALYHAVRFLGLDPPASLAGAAPAGLLAWAVPHWRWSALPARPRRYDWDA